MQTPDPATRCALCDELLVAGTNFCPRCGAESARMRLRPPRPGVQFTLANNIWVALLVIATVFAVVYRLIERGGLTQTYAAFVGLPLLIGILTAYLTRPQNGLGATLKITTIILCLVCPLLGEGAVCILMAAPIIYSIAVIGYLIVAALIRWIHPNARGGPLVLIFLPFLAALLTSDRQHIYNPSVLTAEDSVFVAASPERMWDTLTHGDLVSADFPLFLRLGFPLPKKMERLADGLTRLTFDPGSEPWPGTNVIVSRQRADAAHHRLTFVIEQDGTKLARWLTFQQTCFTVEPRPGGALLRQTTTFRQRMQPGLYWNPLQGFAMGQMHRYALVHLKERAETKQP